MVVKFFGVPFATGGEKIEVPTALQPDGSISYTLGWGPDYELDDTAPGYKPVGRKEMNGMFNAVTAAIGEMQAAGFPQYQPEAAPYPINAYVRSGTTVWRSTVVNNSTVPGATGANWVDASVTAWSSISGKPTTVAQSGLTDAMTIGTGGIGGTASPQSVNVNSLPYGGLWSVNPGTVGAPFNFGSVLHNAYDLANGSWTQLFLDMNGAGAYWRGSINGTVSGMRKFWDSANFDPAGKITADSCPTAGFYAGAKTRPYMLHTDATVVELPTLAQLVATNDAVSKRIVGTNSLAAGFTDGTADSPFMTHNNGTTVLLAKAGSIAGVGVNQTWQDVTSIRAKDVTYTNATSSPIMVSIWPTASTSNTPGLVIGGVEMARIALSDAGVGAVATICGIVPPGAAYSLIRAGVIAKWSELRA